MNARLVIRCVSVCLAAAFSLSAQAQQSAPESASSAAPAPPEAAAVSGVSVEEAYRKEFAFLTAQKRELSQQIDALKAQSERARSQLEAEVATLQAQVIAAENNAERLGDELNVADQATLSNQENSELLQATFAQAQITLEGYGTDLKADAGYAEGDDAAKLELLLRAGERHLAESSSVRTSRGKFYLNNGSEVEGQLVQVGNIATFGVSEQGSGALAPAGGGTFKLWRDESAETARALASGAPIDTLRIFLYENPNIAVSEPEVKTAAGEVAKGGLIGYVIVCLGLVALALIIMRAVFLSSAGSSIGKITEAVEPLLRQRRVDDAIAATKRFKGSAARVVTSALRNLDRDRDHLEDIVSESILHENTRLNRFGAIILMIAGVAPLLGLLGTVTGMIQTFDVITEFGTSDPKLLAGGIATALVTTELGLIVAIPALLFGNLLGGWAERLKDDMEKAALSVINMYKDQPKLAQAA